MNYSKSPPQAKIQITQKAMFHDRRTLLWGYPSLCSLFSLKLIQIKTYMSLINYLAVIMMPTSHDMFW